MMKNHPFHMVTPSPWPIITSMNILTTILSSLNWIINKTPIMMMTSTFLLTACSFSWWKDITRESTMQGNHTTEVTMMMKSGMIMFITSEIMLFISLFWAFFHSSLSPNIELGMNWPPKSIETFNPMEIPLLNTIILLSSGATMTWSHQTLINSKFSITNKTMLMTIMLGIYFTLLQYMEYKQAKFTMADSIYGSVFFMMTGFHGIHVIVGTMFIMASSLRMMKMHFSATHHVGFEAAAWYWHFVDVVWLFLYTL